MIITRTPFRISFAGGGSDLKNYYEKYGGSVLSVSINKYIYLSMHPYFDENGYMVNDKTDYEIDGKTYEFGEDGKLIGEVSDETVINN